MDSVGRGQKQQHITHLQVLEKRNNNYNNINGTIKERSHV
jgi:hypothetical protein